MDHGLPDRPNVDLEMKASISQRIGLVLIQFGSLRENFPDQAVWIVQNGLLNFGLSWFEWRGRSNGQMEIPPWDG